MAFLATAVFGAAWEASYQGKPAKYWFGLQSGAIEESRQSFTAFEAMGSNAVPFLVGILEQKPSKLAEGLDHNLYGNGMAGKIPRSVKEMLPSAMRTEGRREDAAYLLSRLGPNAVAAAPALMTILTDPSEGWRIQVSVRSALFAMGDKLSDYLPEFIHFLKSADSTTRCLGAEFLAGLGPKARSAVPALEEVAAGGDAYARLLAAAALWRIDSQTNLAVTICTSSLESTNVGLRRRALECLRDIGPAAQSAVPKLTKVAEIRDWEISIPVAHTLFEIARQTNVALRVYSDSLQSTNSAMRQQALIYLREMGTAAKTAGPQVVAVFGDHDEQVNHEAERTLQVIDPVLLEATLQKINERTPQAVFDLIQSIRSGDLTDRFRALGIIGAFGAEAKAAVPDLIKLISGPPPQLAEHLAVQAFQLRVVAVQAVGEIGPEASAAVPALLERLGGPQDFARHAYCRALGELGPGAKEAIPVREGILGDADRLARLAAAVARTKIEPEHSSNAVSVLESVKNDPELARVREVDENGVVYSTSRFDRQNPTIRRYSLVASVPLWRLGLTKASPVGPILEELNHSVTPDRECIELLGDIGPEARVALPTLEKLLKPGQYIGTRCAAAIAIKKIDPAEAMRLGLPGLLTLQ